MLNPAMMAAMDIQQVKQEIIDPDFDGKDGQKNLSPVLSMPGTPPSSLPQAMIANMQYLNGMMATRPMMAPSVNSPVLVVPQPFPSYLTYYRPQFPVTAAVATAAMNNNNNNNDSNSPPAPNPYEALDLSKGPAGSEKNKETLTPDGAADLANIPYGARERRKAERAADEMEENELNGQEGDDGNYEIDEDGKKKLDNGRGRGMAGK